MFGGLTRNDRTYCSPHLENSISLLLVAVGGAEGVDVGKSVGSQDSAQDTARVIVTTLIAAAHPRDAVSVTVGGGQNGRVDQPVLVVASTTESSERELG